MCWAFFVYTYILLVLEHAVGILGILQLGLLLILKFETALLYVCVRFYYIISIILPSLLQKTSGYRMITAKTCLEVTGCPSLRR